MPLSAIVVDVAPDLVALASAFARAPGFAFLHGAAPFAGRQRSYVAVEPVATVLPRTATLHCHGATASTAVTVTRTRARFVVAS